MKDMAAAEHCAKLVRERNRPRFVASLFAPEGIRRGLSALYAFDAELTHIPSAAREELIQAMRFQWWRDALTALPSTRGHPVLEELARIEGETEALIDLTNAREAKAGGDDAEVRLVAIAARLCGGSRGSNAMAALAGAAIAGNNIGKLNEARRLWRGERTARRAELPAYLPATVVDMRHPVSEFRLYARMLGKGLANRL